MSARNTRSAGLLAAILVLLSLTGLACASGGSDHATGTATKSAVAPGATIQAQTASTRLYSLKAGGLIRKYEVIAPGEALSSSAPIVVMLSGIGATLDKEVPRDDLLPYAAAGLAELVYPVAVGLSWNADGCCQYAWVHRIDDMDFIKALVAKIDPGHARPIDLVGYSNGARMAYRVACTDPGLFTAYAMVKGGPLANCVVTKPVSVVQLASLDDPEMPYAHGGQKRGDIPVLTELNRLRQVDRCPAKDAVTHTRQLAYTVWSGCAGRTRLGLAAWTAGKHSFPRPPVNVPAGAQVIWAFFTNSKVKALPA
jgi:poly(3-hydroxybutyrate) depolymerase